jgi:predicted transcriptional regulator
MKNKISVKHKLAHEIMSSPVKVMTLTMTVHDAIRFLMVYKLSGAPLVDHLGQLVSLVSELDLMQIGALEGTGVTLKESKDRLSKKSEIVRVKPDTPFVDIFKLFLDNGLRQLLVLDDNQHIVGIIARRDILKAYIDLEGQD